MQQFIQLGWLRRNQFCSLKGMPRESFKKLMPKLQHARKDYYAKRAGDGCVWVHWERFDQWLEKNAHTKG